MNPWIAKAVIVAATIAMVAIRAPHGKRSRAVRTVRSRKGPRETFGILFAFRLKAEEEMMLDAFGAEYASYMATTKRLVRGIW